MRLHWRTCANCGGEARAGCLCGSCLRAAIVPLILAALVQLAVKRLGG